MILVSSIERGDVLVYLASTDARLIPDVYITNPFGSLCDRIAINFCTKTT